jgi:NAD(P)-dependent dehydrogenase (short-subunit alcohol dehydrogenase family)
MRFSDKVVIVTGGAQGIGSELVARFCSEGAVTYVCDIEEKPGRDLVASLVKDGCSAFFCRLDVTEQGSWAELIRRVEQEQGRLDVLVNNAGISIRTPFLEYSVESWEKMMAVNVRGVFLGMQCAIPLMKKNGGGSIVNTSSIASLIGHRYSPIPYIATKGAVTAMTRGIAVQCAADKIRANTVHPSTVETALIASLFKDPLKKRERIDEIPLGRLATPRDVATAVLFLALEEASFITGVSLPVDGGLTAS